MVFLVDGEQTGIGYLGVLVNGDPKGEAEATGWWGGPGLPSSPESKPCPSRQAQVPSPPGRLSHLFLP